MYPLRSEKNKVYSLEELFCTKDGGDQSQARKENDLEITKRQSSECLPVNSSASTAMRTRMAIVLPAGIPQATR